MPHRNLANATLYDIAACTQEIVVFTESAFPYCHNVMEMFYIRKQEDEKIKLLKHFRTSQADRARQVQRESELL